MQPNDLVRKRYRTAQTVIQKEEARKLTQREFLDVSFGNNPRTGKPYNERTLRKWLRGERSAEQAVEHSKRDTYSFSQRVEIDGHQFAPTLTKPSNVSGLDLFTPAGRKRVRRATKERLQQRIERSETDLQQRPKAVDQLTDTDRYLRSTRGMKMRKARAVQKGRAGIIITRQRRAA